MSENDSVHSEATFCKEDQMNLSGNKSRSVNGSPPEGDAGFDMDDPEEEEESDALDTTEPRESAPSPAEPCDESAPKRCVYDGCSETSALGAKQRKPWMCKKHRNKMYKDKYKKKKSDQAMASGKLEVSMLQFPCRAPCSVTVLSNTVNSNEVEIYFLSATSRGLHTT